MASYYGNILEEELKNKVAAEWFADYDATQILGKIDFSVAVRRDTYTLQTCYTLEGMADNDSVLNEEFRNTLSDNLLGSLKGNIQYRKYKERAFVFEYLYYSRSTGRLLMNFTFTPDDYR